MFCKICDGSQRIYTQIDITGAFNGMPCPGKACKCSTYYSPPKILIPGKCDVCEGYGRVYSQLDISGALVGGRCPGKFCPECTLGNM